MAKKSEPKPRENGIMYIFAYFLWWFSGIIVYLFASKDDEELRFHAIQAILLGIVITIFVWLPIPFIGDIIAFILWIYGLYIGYEAGWEDEDMEIPFIGKMAREWSK